ncbi:protein kinase, partial [Trypanosoma grayi]|uniref:protein kinase n=1 Tax=Trypanosoma grayi TaxID=71804 RepID=UPI0004F3F157
MASHAAQSTAPLSVPFLSPALNMNDKVYYTAAGNGSKKRLNVPSAADVDASALPKTAQEQQTQQHMYAYRPRTEELLCQRRSGSKRDHDTATSTDVGQQQQQQKTEAAGAGAPKLADHAGDTKAPVRKQAKVTYILPNQSREEGHFYVVLGEDIDVSTQRFKIL